MELGEVLDAGAIPVVRDGDHSIAEPDIRACAARRGPLGPVQLDTHTDTAEAVFGVERALAAVGEGPALPLG
ncbi:MAG TPA: arginase family protein [Solirubrobacterales bacterium]